MRRFHAWILMGLLLGCGGEPEPEPVVVRPEGDPPPARSEATPAASPPSTAAPWGVAAVRSCSAWASSTLLATDRHVFACDGAVYDAASRRLVRVGFDLAHRRAARGALSLWYSPDAGALIVREGARAERRLPFAEVPNAAAVDAAGRRAFVTTQATAHLVDLSSGQRTSPAGIARCAGSSSLGFDDAGRPQCIDGSGESPALVTLGDDARPVGFRRATWAAGGDLVVGRAEDAVEWVSTDGRRIATRPATREHHVLDVRADGSALISTDADTRGETSRPGATERWWVEDGEVRVEPVYDRPAERGAYVGEQIVLTVYENVVWLHRGPARLPSLEPPPAPAGYVSYEATDEHTFVGRIGTFRRAPHDVAVFGAAEGYGLLRVARSDADELAGFVGLDDWARAAMARYVEVGTERWAKAWTEGEDRLLRGHSYIGGCERTHIDVLVRQRGDVIERWVAHGAEPAPDTALPPAPARAPVVDDGIEPRYAGDPSTGPID